MAGFSGAAGLALPQKMNNPCAGIKKCIPQKVMRYIDFL
jgi:hypothetical protein